MFRIEEMGINSLQVCMDSSDWLQGAISDENTGLMDSSSPPITTPNGEEILTCSRPIIERRLRPQHEQALKCPRCESTHTKFCYYNNYSLSQPRYFCKTCRRYWTKGGTLRNIPVGGGCRKNKKVSSNNSNKKPSSSSSSDRQINLHRPSSSSIVSSPLMLDQLQIDVPNYNHMSRNKAQITDLQLAFPEQLQFSAGLFNNPAANNGYLFENIGPAPIEFMDNKYHDHAFMGSNGENFGGMNIAGQNPNNVSNYHGITAPFGLSCFDQGISNPGGSGASVLESCQRLMLPYDDDNNQNNHHHYHHEGVVDVKPNAKVLSLEWHDCNSDAGIKDSFGYGLGGLGSWTGLMNGYGPSATNPLV